MMATGRCLLVGYGPGVGQGIALVVISSELPELLALSDRIIVLARGQIVDQFTKAEASEQRLMLAATGGMAPPIYN